MEAITLISLIIGILAWVGMELAYFFNTTANGENFWQFLGINLVMGLFSTMIGGIIYCVVDLCVTYAGLRNTIYGLIGVGLFIALKGLIFYLFKKYRTVEYNEEDEREQHEEEMR